MLKSHLALLALLCAPLGLAVGCNGSPGAHAAGSTASSSTALERVTAGKPQRKTLVITTAQPARVEAFEETPLFAKLTGFVKTINVDIGDRVAAGQTLIELSIPELADEAVQKEALVAQAEAEVAQAASMVAASQAAVATAKARIAHAKAGIKRSMGEYQRWRAEHDRIQSLANSGSVSQKLVDETLSQLQAATAAREEAEAAVQSAEAAAEEALANVNKARADQAAAEARVRVAKADLARAKTMLGYTRIVSPFDGTITRRTVDTGHVVQAAGGGAAKPLLVVARTDKMRVCMDIPEMDAALVDVGDEATLTVQALGRKLTAPVARTSWSLDPSNRSLRAEIDLENDGSTLRPGMYAAGVIELARRKNALVLPITAIVRTEADTYCCAVKGGKIDRCPVHLGLRSGSEVEILDGVDDQSVVVLARAESLRPGQEVQVMEP